MRVPTLALTAAAFFVGLALFHWLESRRPLKPEARRGWSRKGYFADFTSLIVNHLALAMALKVGIYWIIIGLPQAWELVGAWPLVLQFAVFLLVNDFGRYWLHRAHHEWDVLWRMHRVHHTATELDALSVFRVHLLEAIIKYGVLVLPFHVVGFNRWVIATYACIDLLKGFWHHANLKTSIGPLNYIFNSGELHWWHHATTSRGQRSNYGSILSIWDWLFGTAHWPRGTWPERIGVDRMEQFPSTWLGQLTSCGLSDEQVIERCNRETASGLKPAPHSPAAGSSAEPSPAAAVDDLRPGATGVAARTAR